MRWDVGFLYYQQRTGITTVVNFTSLPETRLVSRFTSRCSTTCVSSPYPAICQKDYSVTPMSNPSIQQRYYGIKKEGCQHPSPNQVRLCSTFRCELAFYLDTTIHKIMVSVPRCFIEYLFVVLCRVIRDSTIGDLCHWLSPK